MKNGNGSERILFIDDDEAFLKSVRRLFEREYDLETAFDANRALDILRNKGPFALAVCDLKMPGMDGVALLAEIRRRFPETVRMLFTGYADLETAIAAVNSGNVFRILTKPCPREVLDQALRDGLEQYRLLRDRAELLSLRRLRAAMDGVIRGFSSLVEIRDPYTAGHQRRVSCLTEAIARGLGWTADRIEGVRMAALVHDVGKLYVPAEFLNKPGALSDAEFAIIKSHSRVGYEILLPMQFPWPLAETVLQHHERLDGGGYDQGLSGEAILPEARVLAVADVVEAISANRPYRPGLGLGRALEEIERNAGRLYDPQAVAVCLRLFRREGFEHNWR